jgi:thiol-disulfide isomerase/thioredoxin
MTMINFWFMRCPPCLKEFEMFNKLVEKYDDRVDFLSFTFDQSTEVDSLMLIHPFLFDIVPDARDIIDDDFMCFWSYPFSIVANKENRIVYILDDFGRSNNNDEKIVTLDSLIQANI